MRYAKCQYIYILPYTCINKLYIHLSYKSSIKHVETILRSVQHYTISKAAIICMKENEDSITTLSLPVKYHSILPSLGLIPLRFSNLTLFSVCTLIQFFLTPNLPKVKTVEFADSKALDEEESHLILIDTVCPLVLNSRYDVSLDESFLKFCTKAILIKKPAKLTQILFRYNHSHFRLWPCVFSFYLATLSFLYKIPSMLLFAT